jgi:hypothetical protein
MMQLPRTRDPGVGREVADVVVTIEVMGQARTPFLLTNAREPSTTPLASTANFPRP